MRKYICVLLCVVIAASFMMPAFADSIESDDELVTFIVDTGYTPVAEVETDMRSAVNLKVMMDGYADKYEESIEKQNTAILEDVAKKLGISTEDSYIYTQLSSGFSITARRGDIEKILETEGVIDVYEAPELYVVPDDEQSTGEEIVSSSAAAQYRGEGTIIAIIDSGFNITHEYFQAAPSSPKYSQTDAAALITSAGRGMYYNEKIPFMYDYAQGTADVTAMKNYADHGTHVAGIAAGSGGTLPDGRTINGSAPEAQLALMAAGISATGISFAAAEAALDDCYRLGVDVINTSFGIDYADVRASGYSNILNAVSVARNAGIVVCVSAGNAARGYIKNNTLYAPRVENLDYGAMGAYGKATEAFSVASAGAEKIFDTLTDIALDDGTVMAGKDYAVNGVYFKDRVTSTTELCDCSAALTAADCAGVSGKVAVIRRGESSFADKTTRAKNAGAVAAIIYDNIDESYPSISGQVLPTLFLTKQDGEALLASGAASVMVTGQSLHYVVDMVNGGKPSVFSSWGVTEKLELVPNIMGYGGNIYSSGTASNTDYVVKSGTSMSSPYLAGVCACLKSYLNSTLQNVGADENIADTIERRLMSTAVPARYISTGVAYSPRLQGAGLVNPEAAVTTPLTLSGSGGKTLVNLGNKLTRQLTIPFTVHNYSMNDITLDDITVEVLTDGYVVSNGKNYIDMDKSRDLTVVSYTDTAVTAAADGDTAVSISVTLDDAELAANSEIFTNGFYIDGYIRLSNDDNSVGLPFMGFYGDWRELPMFDATVYDEGGSALGGTSLITALNGTTKTLGIGKDSPHMIISPKNGDGKYDALGVALSMYRSSHGLKLSLMQDGTEKYYRTVLKNTAENGYIDKFKSGTYSYTNITGLADGEYTARLTGYFDDGVSLTPKTLDFPRNVIIDNTAPTVSAMLGSDRATLKVKVTDANYLRSLTVSYTDTNGDAQTETVSLDNTKTEYKNTFTVTNPQDLIMVTAVDYAYNSSSVWAQTPVTVSVSGSAIRVDFSDYTVKKTPIVGLYDAYSRLIGIRCNPIGGAVQFDYSPDASYIKLFDWDMENGNTPAQDVIRENIQ